jgi:hypothetical protein
MHDSVALLVDEFVFGVEVGVLFEFDKVEKAVAGVFDVVVLEFEA